MALFFFILNTLFIPLISSAILFIVYWFYKSFIFIISSIPFLPVPRPSYGTQPENPDIPHTGPLLEVPCHSRLPDRSRMYHGLPVQFGIPVRFRSVPVLFRSVYGHLSAAVPVVVDKEPSQAGKPAAADRAAL